MLIETSLSSCYSTLAPTDVNRVMLGWRFLHLAVLGRDREIVEILLQFSTGFNGVIAGDACTAGDSKQDVLLATAEIQEITKGLLACSKNFHRLPLEDFSTQRHSLNPLQRAFKIQRRAQPGKPWTWLLYSSTFFLVLLASSTLVDRLYRIASVAQSCNPDRRFEALAECGPGVVCGT